MLNSRASEGCSGWVDSEVVGLSPRVHAWSLVIVVRSTVATIVVIVVLLPLMLAFSDASLSQVRCADARCVSTETPKWQMVPFSRMYGGGVCKRMWRPFRLGGSISGKTAFPRTLGTISRGWVKPWSRKRGGGERTRNLASGRTKGSHPEPITIFNHCLHKTLFSPEWLWWRTSFPVTPCIRRWFAQWL